LVIEAHRRHQGARLHNIGIGHPYAQVIASVHRDTRPDGLACHQVRKVGAEASIRPRTLNGMAIDARGRFEYLPATRDVWIELWRLLLRRDPVIEVSARLYHHPKQHHRMLGAAKLGTLTEVGSGNLWIYPHRVLLVGNHVGLAGQAGNPEAVRDVGGLEIEK